MVQPIYVHEPIDVLVDGTDLYISLPGELGTIVMPVSCGFRLGVRMLDALADHFLGLTPPEGAPNGKNVA